MRIIKLIGEIQINLFKIRKKINKDLEFRQED